MVRDAGWHLMDAGRRLEPPPYLVETLEATLTTARPDEVETYVLESVLIARTSPRSPPDAEAPPSRSRAGLLDLLVADTDNPRSLTVQLVGLRDDLTHVPAHLPVDARDRLAQDLVDLSHELDPRSAAAAVDGRREQLTEVLESLRWRLTALAREIATVHFAQRPSSRALGDSWGISSPHRYLRPRAPHALRLRRACHRLVRPRGAAAPRPAGPDLPARRAGGGPCTGGHRRARGLLRQHLDLLRGGSPRTTSSPSPRAPG